MLMFMCKDNILYNINTCFFSLPFCKLIINIFATGIDWSWDAATSTASPTGGVHRCTMALALAQQQLKQLQVRLFCC